MSEMNGYEALSQAFVAEDVDHAGAGVVPHDGGGKDSAVRGRELDSLGFGDEVADREHEPVRIDDDAGTLTIFAERRGAARVAHGPAVDLHDRQDVDGRMLFWRGRPPLQFRRGRGRTCHCTRDVHEQ